MDVVAFHCPRCGRAVRLRGGARTVTCRACGGRSLLALRPPAASYHAEPELDAAAAARAAAAFLARPPNAPDLARRATLGEPRLYFAPFHQVTGRRLGVVRQTVPHRRRVERPAVAQLVAGQSNAPVSSAEWVVEEKEDTRVLLSDLHLVVPAFSTRRWELDAFDAGAARLAVVLHATELPALQARGTVLTVTVPADAAAERAVRPQPNVRTAAVQTRTVYFPFWRIPLRYRDGEYEVVLAGAGTPGEVVWANLPGSRGLRAEDTVPAAGAGLAMGLGLQALASGAAAGPAWAAALALGAVLAGGASAAVAHRRIWRRRPITYTWKGGTPVRDP